MEPRTCPCGAVFTPSRSNGRPQKWCSRKCPARRVENSQRSVNWYRANRAYACAREQRRRLKHPDKIRLSELRKRGMNQDIYDALLKAQEGRCAICQTTKPSTRRAFFDIDHDHVHGTLRGLLCERCNRGIGLFHDKPSLLMAAAQYIHDRSTLPFFRLKERKSI